ncbi:hypothetical protein ABQ366_01815 [Serratia fonticola]|uniref:hypothetical protein n=1 Tax=Serratia fonticola TaxID=47917 RepID=UPI003AAD7C4F
MSEYIKEKEKEFKERLVELGIRGIIPESTYKSLIEKVESGNLDSAMKHLELLDIPFAKENSYKHNLNIRGKLKEHAIYEDKIDVLTRKCDELERNNQSLSAGNDERKFLINKLKSDNSELFDTIKELESRHKTLSEGFKKIIDEKNELINEKKILIHEKNQLEIDNNELKNQSQQTRIDERIPDYVVDVSQKLDTADLFFTKMSRNWSITGVILAMLAVTAAFCTFIYGLEAISDVNNLTPTSIIYTFVRGGLGIALLSWISFLSFSNARNYTHESILRKDRQHALTFGRLFLQIYGSTATKEDAINVFKDWNMSGDTAFSSKSKTPPNPMSYVESMKNLFSRSNNANKESSKEDD